MSPIRSARLRVAAAASSPHLAASAALLRYGSAVTGGAPRPCIMWRMGIEGSAGRPARNVSAARAVRSCPPPAAACGRVRETLPDPHTMAGPPTRRPARAPHRVANPAFPPNDFPVELGQMKSS